MLDLPAAGEPYPADTNSALLEHSSGIVGLRLSDRTRRDAPTQA